MTTEIVAVDAQLVTQPASVFGTDQPREIVARATAIADALADAIKQQGMSTTIQGREYVLAEGWAFMGSMLGVFPRTVRVEPIRDESDRITGFEAHVELVTRDGSVVGGAVAECSRDESTWHDRDAYALKSMSQTRAAGKAYRMAFGFVMKAAGYEATPAEEMPPDGAPVRLPVARGNAPANAPKCPKHNRVMREWGGRDGTPPHWKCTARDGNGYCNETRPMSAPVDDGAPLPDDDDDIPF